MPRPCGSATSTRDLRDARLAAGPPTADGSPFVVALDHGGPHDPKTYPPEVRVRLRRGDPAGVARAEASLDAAGVAYQSLEYGSYLGLWRKRNALKMWTGWPTFPMVFVKGVLVGGANDVEKLIESGELAKMLA